MSSASQAGPFSIGWDVGGWNCDRNRESRDAIVVLNAALVIVGEPWRGNLRTVINDALTAPDWIRMLFSLCAADPASDAVPVTLAIDTPLSFSNAFVELLTNLKWVGPVESSDTNPYLFRRTEHFLFEHGLRPLSPIKDMIGSQATKGRHVLAKFAPHITRCGVWTDGVSLTAIEAYPSGCRNSAAVQGFLRRYPDLEPGDKQDALTCALLAYLFASRPETLAGPDESVPVAEGWIWVPKDSLGSPTPVES